jgi:hypothetical protein
MFTSDRYEPSHAAEWNDFVLKSKNGTFLFNRSYMDYHADRFTDHSLLIRKNGKLVALLPANIVKNEIHSHQGLTYGGLVIGPEQKTPDFIFMFDFLLEILRQSGVKQFFYKSIPHIYHRAPAEEEMYALFLKNAQLIQCHTLSVMNLEAKIGMQSRRRRGSNKAKKKGVQISESSSWKEFWVILGERLQDSYGAKPVHSIDEIELLKKRFSPNIRLFTAMKDNEILAGVVIYETELVAHCQYIAASDIGQDLGALDLLFTELIDTNFSEKKYFDFGISNEENGLVLNDGLIEFKEGFGARTVAHKFYQIGLM